MKFDNRSKNYTQRGYCRHIEIKFSIFRFSVKSKTMFRTVLGQIGDRHPCMLKTQDVKMGLLFIPFSLSFQWDAFVSLLHDSLYKTISEVNLRSIVSNRSS